MTPLSNTHQTQDVGAEAYNQRTLVIGLLTIIAVLAVMYFASTA